MKGKPILFSDPLIRAILEGRKTQTRRLIKPQPSGLDSFTSAQVSDAFESGFVEIGCPYGEAGDHLWVREAFRYEDSLIHCVCCNFLLCNKHHGKPIYRASEAPREIVQEKWCPNIHMPRQISRISLEITSVTVERLKDISSEDAEAEGFVAAPQSLPGEVEGLANICEGSRALFAHAWEEFYGAGSWDSNPWVWVITFKRLNT